MIKIKLTNNVTEDSNTYDNIQDNTSIYTLKTGQLLLGDDADIMLNLQLLKPIFNAYQYPKNDIGIANLYSDIFKKNTRFCDDNGNWYCYNDGYWEHDRHEVKIQEKMQRLLQIMLMYCDEIQKTSDTEDAIKDYRNFVNKCSSDHVIRRCINSSKNMLTINLTDFDKDPFLLNCTNGVYNLKTGELTPHSPDYYMTKITNTYPAHSLTPICKRWYSFIDDIMSHDPEKVKFLQRALGYSILGVNREECMFLMYGKLTRNGKGTLIGAISKALSAKYCDNIDTGLICVDKKGRSNDFNSPQPALRKVVGTRIVTMSETDRDVMLSSASMKAITGRDELTTRGLHESSITFVPQFTMWLATNHLPIVNDDTVFKSDRIWVIEFNEYFGDKREDLKSIFQDPANQPTILRWLVDGCKDYLENGLNPPECVRNATNHYREMYDRIGNFIKECCVVDSNEKILRGSLNSAYERWCRKSENRYTPIGTSKFYNEMTIRGFHMLKSNGEFIIKGIGLKPLEENTIPI